LDQGDADEFPKRVAFFHDSVQQAAYQLIPYDERANVRLDIGRRLWQQLQDPYHDNHIFELVGHFNEGVARLRDNEERLRLIRLNLAAAQRAKAATAYGAMLHYYRQAIRTGEHFPGGIHFLLRDHVDLAIDCHLGWGEEEFLEGDPEVGEAVIRQAAAWARDPIRRADIQNALIINYTLLARYQEAIQTACHALSGFGIDLPQDDFDQARDRAIDAVFQALGQCAIASLADDQPQASAMGSRERSVSRRSRAAWSRRQRRISSPTLRPKCRRKRCTRLRREQSTDSSMVVTPKPS